MGAEGTSRGRFERDARGPALTFDPEEDAHIQCRQVPSVSDQSIVARSGWAVTVFPGTAPDLEVTAHIGGRNGKQAHLSDRIIRKLVGPTSRDRQRRNRRISEGAILRGFAMALGPYLGGHRGLLKPESRIPPAGSVGKYEPIWKKSSAGLIPGSL